MLQIAWMLGGAIVIFVMFAFAHRLHGKLGLVPLFTMVGGFQHMQTKLVSSVYVETLPGVFLSPGSVVIFMATLSIVLVVYILEGAEEGRRMIYAVIISNVALSILGGLIVLQTRDVALGSPGTEYVSLLFSSVRVFAGGTIALTIDVIAVIVIYEYVCEKISNATLRIAITLGLIGLVDSVLFAVLAFSGTKFWTISLVYAGIAKMLAGIWYGILFRLYFSYGHFVLGKQQPAQNVFGMLTYRQKFKIAQAQTERDSMTDLYNRGFFDAAILSHIETETPFSVILIDIDDFKAVNDTYGHLGGDRAIIQLKTSMLSTFRDDDIVCRFGGDEFAVLLPHIEAAAALPVSERLRTHLNNEHDKDDPVFEFSGLRISMGIASFPTDGADYQSVIDSADKRLYRAKESGKNRTSTIEDSELLN